MVEAGLVIEAKRARAGRKSFIGGRWISIKAPNLPVESWKLPLHQLSLDDKDKIVSPHTIRIERRPAHLLFAEAWQRCQADPPN